MNKRCKLVVPALASACLAACATQSPRWADSPPPGINAPGVVQAAPTTVPAASVAVPTLAASVPAPPASAASSAPQATLPAASASTVAALQAALPRDARGEPPPTVRVRKVDGDTIQEYRHGSQIYMIVITPKHGLSTTYVDLDGDGRLDPNSSESPVAPVFYTLYTWD